ncbi:ATP binding cassette sub family B [Echinococcus multilocularis]|uniref:Mitochondrial potassium channel ATP-binding subunit n=1 Tax=Echinococcus multilocularis TaxID=6211 RepID=A0A068XTI8_ECHMU|nr:ATP binding cassette sub family B [Echinococcus multilocularis]
MSMYRYSLGLTKPILIRPFRQLYTRFSDIKTVNTIRLHVRRNFRSYASFSLCAAGVAAAFSIPPQIKDGLTLEESLQSLSGLEVAVRKPDLSAPANTLTLKTLCSLILSDLTYLIFAVLGAFGAAYYNIRIPILLGDLINVLAQFAHPHSIPASALRSPALRLCGVFTLQSLCTFAYIGFLATVGERIACRLRNVLFEHVIYQKVRFFDERTSGWIIERITADVQDFKSSFKFCISQGLRSGAQIIGSGIAMYMISPTLTAALMGCLPLVFFVGGLIGNQLRRMSHVAHDKSNATTEIATEAFTHIRSVKSLAMEDQMVERYRQGTSEACRLHENLGYGIGCFQGLSNFVVNGLVLGVLYLGGNLINRGDMDAGQLMAFLVAAQAVHRSLTQISLLFGQIIRGSSAAARISELLSYPLTSEVLAYKSGLSKLPSVATTDSAPVIRFENVTFSYPNRPEAMVFNDLSFEIPAGKVVALVGESGAGKSTVLALLERFYEPLSGRITFDGVDIRAFSLMELRGRLLGYISQEPEIFHTTVRDNILCARPTATKAEILAAALVAQVDAFVRDHLPKAYDSIVGGGSSSSSAGLSGGQRQRLVIARALLKNAPILLLDEATSALDAESEFQVQSALQNAMQGRTVLIVAHRLSTIRCADVIIVMHRGRIVEQGTHEELIKRRGRYYRLLQRQGKDN